MANEFKATDQFETSFETIKGVALMLGEPEWLAPAKLPLTNSISCATVVLMGGHFESFLKSIIEEFIGEVNDINMLTPKIPHFMRIKHFTKGSEYLRKLAKRERNSQEQPTNSEAFMGKLALLGPGPKGQLAWEAFSDTQSNPSPEVIKELLKDVGAESSWSEINKLFTQQGALHLLLTSFLEMRNICAHTGKHPSPPTGQSLQENADMLIKISECIDILLSIRLEQFRLQKVSPEI